MEKKDHQSYRRPYMMGKARGKVRGGGGCHGDMSTKPRSKVRSSHRK